MEISCQGIEEIMILNHINLTVTDVPATKAFFEKYFGLTGMEGIGSKKFDILRDDNDIVMTLMEGKDVSYPDTFHVGFIQPSEEKVDEINARLKDDGYDVEPPKRFHGSWTFYMETPGGFTIEVLG